MAKVPCTIYAYTQQNGRTPGRHRPAAEGPLQLGRAENLRKTIGWSGKREGGRRVFRRRDSRQGIQKKGFKIRDSAEGIQDKGFRRRIRRGIQDKGFRRRLRRGIQDKGLRRRDSR